MVGSSSWKCGPESDPEGLIAGLNTYAYVRDRPTMLIGLFREKLAFAICSSVGINCRWVAVFLHVCEIA
jgi:hypothetical protein